MTLAPATRKFWLVLLLLVLSRVGDVALGEKCIAAELGERRADEVRVGWEVMWASSGMLWGEVARVPSGDVVLGDISGGASGDLS